MDVTPIGAWHPQALSGQCGQVVRWMPGIPKVLGKTLLEQALVVKAVASQYLENPFVI